MRIFIGIFGLILMLASCSRTRDVQGERTVPARKTAELVEAVKQAELDCGWISLKYDVEVKMDKFDDSFKMYVRMNQDSVIWVSATYYAVEVARFLFTPDTVKYMNRKTYQYYIGDYQYVNDKFNVDMNFNMLQDLILGNSASLLMFDDEEDVQKLRSSRRDGAYYLSFLRKGQVRRALKKDDGYPEDMTLNVGLWIDAKTMRASKTEITEFDADRQVRAEYSDFQKACNSYFPYTVRFESVVENEHAKVKTSVLKLSTDKPQSLSFTIPEKYERIAL